MVNQNNNNVKNSVKDEENKALGQVALGAIVVAWYLPDILGFFAGLL